MIKYAREIVESNCKALEAGPKNMENIFKIMFSRPEETMAEWLEDGFPRQMSFGEGSARIRSAAWFLNKKIGAKNAFVALDMENGPEWIIAFWAILMSGNRPYLVNRRHPLSLTKGLTSTLGITWAVSNERPLYPCMLIPFSQLDGEGHEDYEGEFANEFAISTSATTLNEVICIYTGSEVSSQLLDCKGILMQNSLISTFYDGQIKLLAFLPFYHIFGLMAVYFWFAFFSRPMVFMQDYSAESILGTVQKLKVTHIFAVPLLWHTIEDKVKATVKERGEEMEQKFYKGIESSLKLQRKFPKMGRKMALKMFKEVNDELFGKSPLFMISGGGYIRESSLKMFNALGYPLQNGYGMSETGITSVELRENVKYRILGSVGRPLDSVRYEVDEDGVLTVYGDSICHHMIRNGEEIFIEDGFNTGDIVSRDADGFYYIKGRLGDAIIGENGENINPDEIEKDLEIQSAVEFCVFAEGDKKDKAALVIQLDKDATAEDIQAAADSARAANDKLPLTWQIKDFYFTFDTIRPGEAIKVSRTYLERGIEEGSIRLLAFDEVLEGRAGAKEAVPEDNETALRVRKIFAEITGKPEEEIYMDDHIIFDLGAASLDYFSVVMKVGAEFGIDFGFDKESAAYTIRAFCREIDKRLE